MADKGLSGYNMDSLTEDKWVTYLERATLPAYYVNFEKDVLSLLSILFQWQSKVIDSVTHPFLISIVVFIYC